MKRRLGGGSLPEGLKVLDGLPTGPAARSRIVRLQGRFRVEEADFIAGRLRMPDGQPVYVAARLRAHEVALLQARDLLSRSPFLAQLNDRWGRDTLLLHLARYLWPLAARGLMRLYTADALFRGSGEKKAAVLLEEPVVNLPGLCEGISPGLDVEWYPPGFGERARQRLYPLLWLLRHRLRKLRWSLQGVNTRKVPNDDARPALLLLHEDELSADRSYRTQPHWLEPDQGPPPFRTLVIEPESVQEGQGCPEGYVRYFTQREWTRCRGAKHAGALRTKLNADSRRCLLRALTADRRDLPALFAFVRLLETASDLAAFCSDHGVKAFMTCENYLTAADSMQCIAGPLGITTFSYQYSNMSRVGPVMMTTADTMVTFSPLFHGRWAHNGISPGRFVDAGYVYDGAFRLVKERAARHREQLAQAGARFILGFFDENAFKGKYELVTQDDLREEIVTLLTCVITDPSLGLIVKSQFRRNAPSRLPEVEALRSAAEATGRYLELSHGAVRNIVFPAEAAMAADVILGHAVGATAPLEAALAGARVLLLNPYGMKNENDVLYAAADIVYPSLEAALESVHEYRNGNPTKAALGDWSAILPHFDPFRDGQAGRRLRSLLEEALSGRY